jgi:hypothetical protein
MIAKTFFLAKIIHRIGIKKLRDKKSLRQNPAGNGTFFALRAARGRVLRAARGRVLRAIRGRVLHERNEYGRNGASYTMVGAATDS